MSFSLLSPTQHVQSAYVLGIREDPQQLMNNALATPTADELLRGTSRAGQDCDRADRPAEGPQALYAEAARRTKSAREIGEAGEAKEREKWSASEQYGRETRGRVQTARHQAGWDPTPERPDDRVTSFIRSENRIT